MRLMNEILKISTDTNVITKLSENWRAKKSRKQTKVANLQYMQKTFIVTEEVAGDLAKFISKMGELECVKKSFPLCFLLLLLFFGG